MDDDWDVLNLMMTMITFYRYNDVVVMKKHYHHPKWELDI